MDNVYEGGGVIEMDYMYTKWRRFLAWIGLIFTIALAVGIIGGFVWANSFINTGLSL